MITEKAFNKIIFQEFKADTWQQTPVKLKSTFLLDLFYNFNTLTTSKSDFELFNDVFLMLISNNNKNNDKINSLSQQFLNYSKRQLHLYEKAFEKIEPDVANKEEDSIEIPKEMTFNIDLQNEKNSKLSDDEIITEIINKIIENKELRFHYPCILDMDLHKFNKVQSFYEEFCLGFCLGDIPRIIRTIYYMSTFDIVVDQHRLSNLFPVLKNPFDINFSDSVENVSLYKKEENLQQKISATKIDNLIFTISKDQNLVILDTDIGYKGTFQLSISKKEFSSIHAVESKLVLISSNNEIKVLEIERGHDISIAVNEIEQCDKLINGSLPIASDGKFIYQITSDKELNIFTLDEKAKFKFTHVKTLPIIENSSSNSFSLTEDFLSDSFAFCNGITFTLIKNCEFDSCYQIVSYSVLDGSFIENSHCECNYNFNGLFNDPYEKCYWLITKSENSVLFCSYEAHYHEIPFIMEMYPNMIKAEPELTPYLEKEKIHLSEFLIVSINYLAVLLVKLIGYNAKELKEKFPYEYELFKDPSIANSVLKILLFYLKEPKIEGLPQSYSYFLIKVLFMIIYVNRTINMEEDIKFMYKFSHALKAALKNSELCTFVKKFVIIGFDAIFSADKSVTSIIFHKMHCFFNETDIKLMISRNQKSPLLPFIFGPENSILPIIIDKINSNGFYPNHIKLLKCYIKSLSAMYGCRIKENETSELIQSTAICFLSSMISDVKFFFRKDYTKISFDFLLSLYICTKTIYNNKRVSPFIIDLLIKTYESFSNSIEYLINDNDNLTYSYSLLSRLFVSIKSIINTLLNSKLINRQEHTEMLKKLIYKDEPQNDEDQLSEKSMKIKMSKIFKISSSSDSSENISKLITKIKKDLKKSENAVEKSKHKARAELQNEMYKKQIANRIDFLYKEGIVYKNNKESVKKAYEFLNGNFSLDELIECIAYIKLSLNSMNRIITNEKTPIPHIINLIDGILFYIIKYKVIRIYANFQLRSNDITNLFVTLAHNFIKLIPKVDSIIVTKAISIIILELNLLKENKKSLKIINSLFAKIIKAKSNMSEKEMEFNIVFLLIFQGILINNSIINPSDENKKKQMEILGNYPRDSFQVLTALSIAGYYPSFEADSLINKYSMSPDFHSSMLYVYECIMHSKNDESCDDVLNSLLALTGSILCGESVEILNDYINYEYISFTHGEYRCKTPEMLFSIAHYIAGLFKKLLLTEKKEKIKDLFIKIILGKSSSDLIEKQVAVLFIMSNSFETLRPGCLMKLNDEKDLYYIDDTSNFQIEAFKLPITKVIEKKIFLDETNIIFYAPIKFTPKMCDIFQVLVILFQKITQNNVTFYDSLIRIMLLGCLHIFISDISSGANYCVQFLSVLEKENFSKFEFSDYARDVITIIKSLLIKLFQGAFTEPNNKFEFMPVSLTQIVENGQIKIDSNSLLTLESSQLFITPVIVKNSKLTVDVNSDTKSIFGIIMFDIKSNRELMYYFSGEKNCLYFNGEIVFLRVKREQVSITFKFFPCSDESQPNLKIEFSNNTTPIIHQLPVDGRYSFFVISPQVQNISYKLTNENVTFEEKKKGFLSRLTLKKDEESSEPVIKNPYYMPEEINYERWHKTEKFYNSETGQCCDPFITSTMESFDFSSLIMFEPDDSNYLTYSKFSRDLSHVLLNRATGEISIESNISLKQVNSEVKNAAPPIHFTYISQLPIEIMNMFLSGISNAFKNEIITLIISKLVSTKLTQIDMTFNVFNLTKPKIINFVVKLLLYFEPLSCNQLYNQHSPIDFNNVNSLSSGFVLSSKESFDHYVGLKNLINYIKQDSMIKEFMEVWICEIEKMCDDPNMHFVKQCNPFFIATTTSEFKTNGKSYFIFTPQFNVRKICFQLDCDIVFPDNKKEANYAFINSYASSVSVSFAETPVKKLVYLPFDFSSNETLFDTVFELLVSIKYFIIMVNENFEKLDEKWIYNSLFRLFEKIFNSVINFSPLFYSHYQEILDFVFGKIHLTYKDIPDWFNAKSVNMATIASNKKLPDLMNFTVNIYNDLMVIDGVSSSFSSLSASISQNSITEEDLKVLETIPTLVGKQLVDVSNYNYIKRILSPNQVPSKYPYCMLLKDWELSFKEYPPAKISLFDDQTLSIEFQTKYVPKFITLKHSTHSNGCFDVIVSTSSDFSSSVQCKGYNIEVPCSKFYVKFITELDIDVNNFIVASNIDDDHSFVIFQCKEEFEKDFIVFMNDFTEKEDQIILSKFDSNLTPEGSLSMEDLSDYIFSVIKSLKTKNIHMIDLRMRILFAFRWIVKTKNLIMNNSFPSSLKRFIPLLTSVKLFKKMVSLGDSNETAEIKLNLHKSNDFSNGESSNPNKTLIAQFSAIYTNPNDFMNSENAFNANSEYSAKEIIKCIFSEMMNKRTCLFIETPNKRNKCGIYRECLIPFHSQLESENIGQYDDIDHVYLTIGGLIAMSVKMGLNYNLLFPPLFWKYLCYGDIGIKDIFDVDEEYAKNIKSLENSVSSLSNDEFEKKFPSLDNTVISMSGEKIIIPNVPNHVTRNVCERYIAACNSYRILEIEERMEFIRKGFYDGLGFIGVLSFITPDVIEYSVCGQSNISVSTLMSLIEFRNSSKEMVKTLEETLKHMENEELEDFLLFAIGMRHIPYNAEFPLIVVEFVEDNSVSISSEESKISLPSFSDKSELYKSICKTFGK